MKIKLRRTDQLFSAYIRNRDGWKCQACGNDYRENPQGLHNSHFWSRGKEATRFEPDNCIALCLYHHQLWGHGDERDEYKSFMIRKLGMARFKSLDVQAHTYKKRDDKMDLLFIKSL